MTVNDRVCTTTPDRPQQEQRPAGPRHAARPAYEPPRIARRRSIARATLFTGSGPTSGGLVGAG